jgi:hypothetical protein
MTPGTEAVGADGMIELAMRTADPVSHGSLLGQALQPNLDGIDEETLTHRGREVQREGSG